MLCACFLAGSLFCPIAVAEPPTYSEGTSSDVIAEFSIPPHGNVVTMPVTIGDRRYPFEVDTGGTYLIFDKSLVPRDELVRHASVFEMGEAAPLFRVPEIRVGGFPTGAGSKYLSMALLHELFALSGQDVYGVVGSESLKERVFSIDFDRGKIALLRRVGPEAGTKFKVELLNVGQLADVPFITVELPGGPERFLIDTGQVGFSAGSIERTCFDRLSMEGQVVRLAGSRKVLSFSEGEIEVRFGRLGEFSFGAFRHRGLIFGRGSTSILGLGYLSRYVVTFDFPNRLMYLRPGKEFARAEEHPRGGIEIGILEGRTTVASVAEGGASQKAGLKFMDEITSVDGLHTAKTSIFELCRRFTRTGQHQVEFVRDGKKRHTTVVIEPDVVEETHKERSDN